MIVNFAGFTYRENKEWWGGDPPPPTQKHGTEPKTIFSQELHHANKKAIFITAG